MGGGAAAGPTEAPSCAAVCQMTGACKALCTSTVQFDLEPSDGRLRGDVDSQLFRLLEGAPHLCRWPAHVGPTLRPARLRSRRVTHRQPRGAGGLRNIGLMAPVSKFARSVKYAA